MPKKLIQFDWALKRLLRHKADYGILEGFLTELLGEEIRIESILDPEGNKDTEEAKFNRLDILCIDSSGKLILVELQNYRQSDYLQRILFGTSKVVVEYIKSGDPYSEIRKIHSVSIVYFDLGHGEDYIYHGTTSFKGIHTAEELALDKFQIDLYGDTSIPKIFPEYWLLKVNNFDDIAKNTLDEWVYFLKNASIPDGARAKGLKEAEEKLDVLRLSAEERAVYDRYQDDLHYYASMYQSKCIEERVLGREEGREEGIKEGEAKGRQKEREAIAIKMLPKHDDQTISELTELPISRIVELRKEHFKKK